MNLRVPEFELAANFTFQIFRGKQGVAVGRVRGRDAGGEGPVGGGGGGAQEGVGQEAAVGQGHGAAADQLQRGDAEDLRGQGPEDRRAAEGDRGPQESSVHQG